MTDEQKKRGSGPFLVVLLGSIVVTALVTALLLNISDRKDEARVRFVRVVEVDEDTTDPAIWGKNWPAQYDSYKRTAIATRTRFGGHGGSEALPQQKIDKDPWLKRMFLGYAFSIDYRDRRGPARRPPGRHHRDPQRGGQPRDRRDSGVG